MYPSYVIKKAKYLRRIGMTVPLIAEMLNVSKSSVMGWLKDYPVPSKVLKSKLKNRKSFVEKWSKVCSDKRAEAYKDGRRLFNKFKSNRLFRDFVVIYLTEGYRKNRNQVSVSNSNPEIIKISYTWIKRLAVGSNIFFKLQFYPNQNKDKLVLFWSNLLKIKSENISCFPKSNAGKLSGRKWNCLYGVFQIGISDTYLRSKLQACMDAVQKQWRAVA